GASHDEDTLTGIPVPSSVDTMVVPAARVDEWLQTAEHAAPERPPPPPRRTHRTLWTVVGIALVAGVAALVVWLLSRQHFIGAAGTHVAVYQGVPWNLPRGLHLYRAVYVSPLLVSQLSQAERTRL